MGVVNRIRRKLFGEILVADGLLAKEQLDEALELQKSTGDFLGSILLELGYISETDIVKTLSIQYQIPFLRPSLYDLDRKLLQKFKPEFLHLHKVLPLDQIGNLLLLVVTDIPRDEVVRQIQDTVQSNLAIYLGSISEVDRVLRELFPLTEADEEKLRRQRRGQKGASQASRSRDEAESEVASESAEQEMVLTSLDTSWESIFDEAEGKLKGKDKK